jgi:hypothetical protein
MFLQLLILAVAATAYLVILRSLRGYRGLTPLPEGRARLLFFFALLFMPPIALDVVGRPTMAAGELQAIVSVPLYLAILGALAFLMGLLALVVRLVVHGRPRRLLMLALVGSEGEPDLVADPPLTAVLAESLALVDRTNAAFPRGLEFPLQVDRDGFRGAWDALDAATRTLEGRIADDSRLGLAVASAAKSMAGDARGRLETLRRLAVDHGQAWAAI